MRKKDIIFCIILLMLQFIPTACRDDYFMNEEIGEGNATLSVTLCFDQEDAALGLPVPKEVMKAMPFRI